MPARMLTPLWHRRKEAAAKSRQDAKRPNVIISERWDKKAARCAAFQA